MKSIGSSFDTILEALTQQKQVLEDLQAENEVLRQQFADLKAGRGIYLAILGTLFPLDGAPDTRILDVVSNNDAPVLNTVEGNAPALSEATAAESDASLQETTLIQAAEPDPALQQTASIAATAVDFPHQPTTAISSEALQVAERETPLPGSDFVIEDVSENGVPIPAHSSSTFLEDALLAEFSTASTRHVGNWSGPITNTPTSNGPITNNPNLDEDEKAALRRELMGSYILE